MEEKELTEEAKKRLEKARKIPLSDYIALQDYRKEKKEGKLISHEQLKKLNNL